MGWRSVYWMIDLFHKNAIWKICSRKYTENLIENWEKLCELLSIGEWYYLITTNYVQITDNTDHLVDAKKSVKIKEH